MADKGRKLTFPPAFKAKIDALRRPDETRSDQQILKEAVETLTAAGVDPTRDTKTEE
jgi:hypothetical protein